MTLMKSEKVIRKEVEKLNKQLETWDYEKDGDELQEMHIQGATRAMEWILGDYDEK